MSIIKVYTLIGCLVFSNATAFCAGNADSLYKVLKIKTKGNYYVICAQRNDSLFKIISKMVSIDKKRDSEKLRKGKSYYFDFGKISN